MSNVHNMRILSLWPSLKVLITTYYVSVVSVQCMMFYVQTSSPKPVVVTSPAVREKQSPGLTSDVTEPPAKPPSPAPVPPAVTTAEPVAASDAEKDSSRLEDLETELELDLENMKLDNIDTTVCERQSTFKRLTLL